MSSFPFFERPMRHFASGHFVSGGRQTGGLRQSLGSYRRRAPIKNTYILSRILSQCLASGTCFKITVSRHRFQHLSLSLSLSLSHFLSHFLFRSLCLALILTLTSLTVSITLAPYFPFFVYSLLLFLALYLVIASVSVSLVTPQSSH